MFFLYFHWCYALVKYKKILSYMWNKFHIPRQTILYHILKLFSFTKYIIYFCEAVDLPIIWSKSNLIMITSYWQFTEQFKTNVIVSHFHFLCSSAFLNILKFVIISFSETCAIVVLKWYPWNHPTRYLNISLKCCVVKIFFIIFTSKDSSKIEMR